MQRSANICYRLMVYLLKCIPITPRNVPKSVALVCRNITIILCFWTVNNLRRGVCVWFQMNPNSRFKHDTKVILLFNFSFKYFGIDINLPWLDSVKMLQIGHKRINLQNKCTTAWVKKFRWLVAKKSCLRWIRWRHVSNYCRITF